MLAQWQQHLFCKQATKVSAGSSPAHGSIMNSSVRLDSNFLACGSNNWIRPNNQPGTIEDTKNLLPENPTQYSAVLKFSNSQQSLTDLVVDQGYECSVDINNHSTVTLQGTFGNSTPGIGNQLFSVKGGSTAFLSGVIKGSGNRLNADILVDNWSDQSFNGSKVDLTNLRHETGRKVMVVFRYGASTIIGAHEKLVWESIKMTVYWWVKWIVRKVSGIKLGEKGPSWL